MLEFSSDTRQKAGYYLQHCTVEPSYFFDPHGPGGFVLIVIDRIFRFYFVRRWNRWWQQQGLGVKRQVHPTHQTTWESEGSWWGDPQWAEIHLKNQSFTNRALVSHLVFLLCLFYLYRTGGYWPRCGVWCPPRHRSHPLGHPRRAKPG